MTRMLIPTAKQISDLERPVWDSVCVLKKQVTTPKQQSCDVSWNDQPTTRATGLGSEKQGERPSGRIRFAVIPPIYCAIMLLLVDIAEQITKRRKTVGMSQAELAKRALVSRSTLESLENGRIGELGYAKINRILMALGLEFKMQEMNLSRPTLDELMIENEREDALLRRSKAARIHRGFD
jgi:transcriptional regulator with XRE-family HTH domain